MYLDLTTATDLDETKNNLNILKMPCNTREREHILEMFKIQIDKNFLP